MRFIKKNRIVAFLMFFSGVMFLGALFFTVSRNSDMDEFVRIIQEEIESSPGTGKFVEELNEWVYYNKGFAKNDDYYLWSKLGPTPRQILAKGGDCSDKSRLLSAMLSSVGMDSTLVMLYGCENCRATHTVVEAQYDNGQMAADPVFNIVFPKNIKEYWGLKELQNDPSLLINRLDELVVEKGPNDKIALYPREIETYTWLKTINWNARNETKIVGNLVSIFSDEPFLVSRPHFLEDPKLFYAYFFSGMGIFFLLLSMAILWIKKRKAPPELLVSGCFI
ncbi:MAG: hypothetical protein K0U54_10415 [Bacteroidetes bacterium]|nr:hypothetical protein [Bacteroidota bacterium]